MNDLKLYFYRKYVNTDLSMSDIHIMEKTHTGRKIEYDLIDKLLLKNLKKSYLEMFLPLELFGTQIQKEFLSTFEMILNKLELSANEEKELEFFIKNIQLMKKRYFKNVVQKLLKLFKL